MVLNIFQEVLNRLSTSVENSGDFVSLDHQFLAYVQVLIREIPFMVTDYGSRANIKHEGWGILPA